MHTLLWVLMMLGCFGVVVGLFGLFLNADEDEPGFGGDFSHARKPYLILLVVAFVMALISGTILFAPS